MFGFISCVTSVTCIMTVYRGQVSPPKSMTAHFCIHYSYMQISNANIDLFIFYILQSPAFSASSTKFATNLRPQKSGVGAGSGPSPHSTFTRTQTETWATGRGPAHHHVRVDKLFTIWKMPLFLLSYILLLPLYSHLVFFSPFIVFISGPRERNSQGDKKLCYLCYLKMSYI